MWPSQGPTPPVASTNPAYPPGYSYPCPPAGPGAFPPPSYTSYPASQYPPSQYPPSQYPPSQYPPGQFPPGQYPGMAPHPYPGAMPCGGQGAHAYPPAPGGYPHVPPVCGYPGPFPHPSKGYHFGLHKGHQKYYPPHHHGMRPMPGGLAAGVVAVGMGLMGHKAHKKMKKRMKKAHKGHKYWYGKSYSSSSSSDSD